jgi:hypothetical protein
LKQVLLSDVTAVLYRYRPFCKADLLGYAGLERDLGNEGQAGGTDGAPEGPEYGAIENRLRRLDRCVSLTRNAPGYEPQLEDQLRLDAKEGWLP